MNCNQHESCKQNATDISFTGNLELLDLRKIAFLSSRRIAPEQVLKCYDWATEQRMAETCIIGGFHSDLEKDVLRFLLKRQQPVVIVLARRLYARIPDEWQSAYDTGCLLIVSTSSADRASESTTRRRNRYIIEQADQVVIGSLSQGGKLAELISDLPPKKIVLL